MPENTSNKLVTIEYDLDNRKIIDMANYRYDDWYYSHTCTKVSGRVIAWMPLPEKKTITIPYEKWKELNEMADYQRTQKPESLYSGFVNGHPVCVSCCPKCGNELDEGDKVCPECGQRIDWSEDKEEE